MNTPSKGSKTPRLRQLLWGAGILALALLVSVGSFVVYFLKMPGANVSEFGGPLNTALARTLRSDVRALTAFGVRHDDVSMEALHRSGEWVHQRLLSMGYEVEVEGYEYDGRETANYVVEVPGRESAIIVVGAHYDSCDEGPGANDNGSGLAALLALAESFREHQPEHRFRFVAFSNEEPPHFHDDTMGSRVNARNSTERGEEIVAMFSLETMGYYSDEANSQLYPAPLSAVYPDRGNFIGFVGDTNSVALVRESVETFRSFAKIPSEGAALPAFINGVGWSDHRSFWEQGHAALMITDTAPFRYPHYHEPTDTEDKIDYDRLAEVVRALDATFRRLDETL